MSAASCSPSKLPGLRRCSTSAASRVGVTPSRSSPALIAPPATTLVEGSTIFQPRAPIPGQDVRVEYAGRVERGPDPGEQRALRRGADQREPAGLERADAVLGRDRPAERGHETEHRVLV